MTHRLSSYDAFDEQFEKVVGDAAGRGHLLRGLESTIGSDPRVGDPMGDEGDDQSLWFTLTPAAPAFDMRPMYVVYEFDVEEIRLVWVDEYDAPAFESLRGR